MARAPLPLSRPPGSLFILRFSALGDVTHMVPVVRSIQAEWPGTRITWCLAGLENSLLGDLDGIETVIFRKSGGAAGFLELRRQLAGRRFDVLVHAQVSLRSNFASLAVRAPVRLGYDRARARDLHGLFVTHRIPAARGQHVLDSFFSFAETLGVTRRELRWDIPVPEAARAFAEAHVPAGQPALVISPCSSHVLRNWRPERYAAVADHAARTHGFRVLLCGGPGPAERGMGEAIEARMRSRPVNLIGKDTMKQLLAVLARATVVISPDSGPMHMATAVGTPVIGLHAASNPERSGPYLSRRWCVNRYDDAARRFLGRSATELQWGTKIERPGVMDLVTVDDVVERLDAFVAARAREGGQGQ